MTSKERVEAALHFTKPDRMPFNFWMDRRLLAQWEQEYGPDFRQTYFDADVIETFPLLSWPGGKYIERDGSFWHTEPLIKDWKDADSLRLPSASDEGVFDHIRSNLQRHPDRAVFVNIPGPFTVLHPMRLLDNLYFDVHDYPDELHRLIERIMDIQNAVIEQVVQWPITALYFQDDIASSNGLMFSLPMIKEFVFSTFERGITMARAAGKPVVYHSDGNVTGVLDTKHYGDELNRSWIFRSVGYGHNHQVWKDMMSALRMVGYDGPISIEHEDSLMSQSEGLQKAIEMLKNVMIFEGVGEMWWA